jgi:hypothetical protein
LNFKLFIAIDRGITWEFTTLTFTISDPIPQVSWFKEDGTHVIPDSHYEINYDIETGNAELLIKERIPYSPPPEIFIPFDSSRSKNYLAVKFPAKVIGVQS